MTNAEENPLIALRCEKMEKLRAMNVPPFGNSFLGTESTASLFKNFEAERKVRFAGRVMTHRDMGKSHFMHLQDQFGKIQIYIQPKNLTEEETETFKLIDLGDWIGVDGSLFETKTGEKSIRVEKLTFLTKAMRPLPDKWHGLSDTEARYRQRYLDLATNEESRRVFLLRSRILSEMRRFLESRGFMEVETPMMQTVPGGAAARPFLTHHNALDIDIYMRIAPELYLKRLLVGGFEKIFEVNRNFRNEGISRKHNPEFTMLEAYWAYANFEMFADLVEAMVCHLAENIIGTLTIARPASPDGTPQTPINLQQPWKRRRYHDCIRDAAGADWFELTPEKRKVRAQELGVEISPAMVDFEVTQQIFEKLVEAKTVDPLYVTHLPKELVPLARQNVENPNLVDVYELIINGQEISPGYTELNDPLVQRERLEHQAGEEIQKIDEDFLLALEHGMPPAGGIGLGVDRLIMLLTSTESIRDVILFPLLKPKV